MNPKTLSLVLLLCAITLVTAHGGGGKGKGKGKAFNCKGEALKVEDMKKGKKECMKEINPDAANTEDKEARKKARKENKGNVCIDVCVWKKNGILKEDGTYSSEGADTYIKSAFPEKVHADMKKAFDECGTASSSEFSMDNKCAGYKKFKKCSMKKFFEICEIKRGKGGKKGGKGGKGGDKGEDADVDAGAEAEGGEE